jgi:hypothetical protein
MVCFLKRSQGPQMALTAPWGRGAPKSAHRPLRTFTSAFGAPGTFLAPVHACGHRISRHP